MFYFLRRVKFWTTFSFIDFVLKLKRIKIIEAKTDKEKKMVYRLRYKVYNEYDYINSKNFSDKELKDEEDKHSISYLALTSINKPVGTVRLIFGDKKEDFPSLWVWNVDFNNFFVSFQKTGELSKLCMDIKDKRHWIWLGMIREVYKKSKKLDLNYWIFGIPESIKSSINKRFYTPIYTVPRLKDTELNIQERNVAANYFQSRNPLLYFVKIKEFGRF